MQGHAHHTILTKVGGDPASIATDRQVRGRTVIQDYLPDACAGMDPEYPAYFFRDIQKIIGTVDDFEGMRQVIPLWGRYGLLVKHAHGERFSLCPRGIAYGEA
jgi:hypothetical protein